MSVETVELGGIRVHVLVAHPGMPGEGDRLLGVLRKLDPAVVLADLDASDALRIRAALADRRGRYEPGFVDALYAEESRRRFAPDDAPHEPPMLSVARWARDRHIDMIPVRPLAAKPGFFARRRARKAARRAEAADPGSWPAAFAAAMRDAGAPQGETDTAHKRVMRALGEGRAPVVLLVQAHRAESHLALLREQRRIPA